MHAVDAELPEHRGHLADPGDGAAVANLELPAGGRAVARSSGHSRLDVRDNARPNCSSRCIWASPPSVTDLEKR